MNEVKLAKAVIIQAAIVIHSFAIRDFDYSRTRKQGKITNNDVKMC